MQDRIILGNGKANNIKFNLAGINSWEQFVAANAAGTLQADVTYNNDGTGTSVIGTLLNKANLLTDATAASLGVTSSDPTIEEAFSSLTVTQEVIDAFAAIGIDISGQAIVNALKLLASAAAIGYGGRQLIISELESAAAGAQVSYTPSYSGLLFVRGTPDGASASASALVRVSVVLDNDAPAVLAEGLGGTTQYNTAGVTVPVTAGREYRINFYRCKGSAGRLYY